MSSERTPGESDAARLSRGGMLAGLGALPLLALSGGCAPGSERTGSGGGLSRTKLVILGTGGGPVVGDRHMAANVIVEAGVAYVVDCGLGVTTQLVRAGVALASVRNVFITHHHPDHNVEYGPLLLLSWIAGRRAPVAAYGPPPLARMTADYERMQGYTEEQWSLNVGTPAFAPTVVREFGAGGVVMRDERVTVTCAVVNHPPIRPAFAYRFDFRDRSIVFSGDTTKVEALIELARGADVLVHEAMYEPAMALEMNALGLAMKLQRKAPPDDPARILASVHRDHTPVDQAGAVAAAAGVKTLVLTHFVPSGGVPDALWRSEAARHFPGRIVVARDLDVI